jgi:DHA2 family multidrug resistance protein
MAREQNNQVSGMNAFVRNIGGSIGIALITTLLTRQGQKHTNYLASRAIPGSAQFDQLVNGLKSTFEHSGSGSALATQQAHARVYQMIEGQASALAYVDVLSYMSIAVAVLIPFVMLMRRGKPAGSAPAAH